jgi:DNA-binding NarL/FixJ family response regulator
MRGATSSGDPERMAEAVRRAEAGVTAITELARHGVTARVLVLTTYDTDSYVLPAIEAGATGYLLKDALSDDLLRAVRAVRAVRAAAHGESVLAPTVAARLLSRVRSPGQEPLPGKPD